MLSPVNGGAIIHRHMGLDESREIRQETLVVGNSEIAFTPLDGDLLGMDERAGYCYSLNSSAADIWNLIQTPVSVESICCALRSRFDVDSETCRRDVAALLADMVETGLVRILPADGK